MKKMLLPGFVSSCLAATAVLLPGTGAQAAQPYGQMPAASVKSQRRTAYAPTPPSYASSAGGATAPRPATLEAKVSQLAQNDQRQDQRLHHLERDVRSLKPKGAQPPAPASYETTPPSTRLHTVRGGETLWRIAARYNTSVNAIRSANRISGDTVAVGQTLVIPGDEAPGSAAASPGIHIVRAGETFSGIAARYRVTQDSLAQANPAAYPDRLLVGERLSIPGAKATPSSPAATPQLTSPESGKTHIVRSGESLGVIAKKYGISTAGLAAANKLKNPNLVEVGQKLVIPSGPPRSTPQPPAPGPMMAQNPVDQAADTTPLPGAGLAALPRPLPAPIKPKEISPPPSPALAPAPAPVSKHASMPLGQTRGVVAYRLEKGDDINTVANVFGTTPANIRELNLLSPTDELKEGQEIVVPALGPIN